MNKVQRTPQAVPSWVCRKSDKALSRFAQRKADGNARRVLTKANALRAYQTLSEDAAQLGIRPPTVGKEADTLQSALARLQDPGWWRRRLRQAVNGQLEREARDAGRVHKGAGIYASDACVERRKQQRSRNRHALGLMEATNELGESFTLEELQELSVSNPRIRRCELMARISGFERIARELGHVAEFYTLSCPARMHCRHARNGEAVGKYDGTTPTEANRYLGSLWAKVRAKLHREGLRPYGVRVAEPHHDGTPHWHLLLFMPQESVTSMRDTLRNYALEADGNEPGASRHRFRVEAIDPEKGSAVGYVAKYISKNIDGYGIDQDTYGTSAEAAAARIEAWASTWRIRQFQQIGGSPVSLWRECRRARNAPAGVLADACHAADRGDWARFVSCLSGPQAPRKALPVELAKAWSDEPSRYGEPKGYATFGVKAGEAILLTRVHRWVIAPAAQARAGHGERPAAAWPATPTHYQVGTSAAHPAAKPPLEFCQ